MEGIKIVLNDKRACVLLVNASLPADAHEWLDACGGMNPRTVPSLAFKVNGSDVHVCKANRCYEGQLNTSA